MDVLGNLSKVSVIDISYVMGLIFAGVMIDALQLTMSIHSNEWSYSKTILLIQKKIMVTRIKTNSAHNLYLSFLIRNFFI